jgi:hypothetical protein
VTLALDSAGAFVGAARDGNLDRAKQLGATVICCYIVGNPGGSPHVVKADVDAIRERGLLPYANWERAANFFAAADQAACVAAGQEAETAMRACGWPAGSACAFSFDYDVPIGAYSVMLQKLEWCQAGSGADYVAVPYGSAGLLTYAALHGEYAARGYKGWLSESTFGEPGYVDAFTHAALVQNHDAAGNWLNSPLPGCDVNTILDPAALGAWGPANGDDMPTAKEIAQAVWAEQIHNTDATGKPTSGNHPASSWLTQATVNAAHAATTPIDTTALAQQIITALGTDLAREVAAELGAALIAGSKA